MELLQTEPQTDVFALARAVTGDRDLLNERAPLQDPFALSAISSLATKPSLGPREVVPTLGFFQHEDHL